MKLNLPVLNIEAHYPKGEVLVSKTDLKGTIIYANDSFISLSGFSKEELLGKNHNIVRHPDMPPEAFEDLWETVKQGLPWKGLVKNRCKDGRYYWVNAFVVPIFKNGSMSGFMSVRTEPSRNQISNAEALYRKVVNEKVSLSYKGTAWEKVPLKTKFIASLGGMCLSLLLIAGISNYMIESMHTEFQNESIEIAKEFQIVSKTLSAQVHFKIQVQEWKNILLRGQDDALYEKYLASFTKEEGAFESALEDVVKMSSSAGLYDGKAKKLLLDHKLIGDAYRAALKNFDRKSPTGYQKVDLMVRGIDRDLTSNLSGFVQEVQEHAQNSIDVNFKNDQKRFGVNRLILIVAVVLALIITGLMFVMLNNMMKTIRQMIAFLSEIARGKLDNDIPTDRRDEMGRVLSSLASMQVSLRVMMDELRLSVENIFDKLRILDRTAQDTRDQSNRQNERVREVSAAMEQVAISVSEVAKSASEVLDAAQTSLSVVNQGSTSMNDSLNVTERAAQSVRTSSEKINELNVAVQQISGVTMVIKEIAEQTNLLALNAAIEAARAGEQGRGFAVVADEVRKLAEKTSGSTTAISKMLDQVIAINSEAVAVMTQVESQVGDARHNLDITEESFGDIRSGSQHVTEMARSIADATKEQSAANQAVASNMEKMSDGVEKTSNLVNELHDATAKMKATADELKNMLAQFNVEIR